MTSVSLVVAMHKTSVIDSALSKIVEDNLKVIFVVHHGAKKKILKKREKIRQVFRETSCRVGGSVRATQKIADLKWNHILNFKVIKPICDNF